jgi:hypothetical protein
MFFSLLNILFVPKLWRFFTSSAEIGRFTRLLQLGKRPIRREITVIAIRWATVRKTS